ncbi:hypothetical protein NC652_001935 [Populus alba x Populus x berolinensis]|nr:hypothetical protein NC652_001935 [Populus alba x Populus x berolinensis]
MDSCDYAHGKWFWLQFYFMLSMATNVLESEWLAWEVSGCQFPFKFRVIHVHVVWKTVYNMLNPGEGELPLTLMSPKTSILHIECSIGC